MPRAVRPPMSFPEKVRAMMERSGDSYTTCLRRLCSAGGRAAARNKRRRKEANARRQQLETAKGIA